MPPFWAAVEILASPIANKGIPQACDRPTLGLVAAGPADSGPFTNVIGATTGARPTAQPATKTAQDDASTRGLNMNILLPWPGQTTEQPRNRFVTLCRALPLHFPASGVRATCGFTDVTTKPDLIWGLRRELLSDP